MKVEESLALLNDCLTDLNVLKQQGTIAADEYVEQAKRIRVTEQLLLSDEKPS